MNTRKKRYADRFVGRTPSDEQQLEDRQKKVLSIFAHYKFERILDVGCGDGNFSVLLQEACNAKDVYGLEISAKGVELARSNGVNCLQLDIDEDDFPFEAEYFDAVFAGEVIEHVFDTDHFLDEVHRVLKPEGMFVLTTPNLAAIHNRIALLFGYQPFPLGVSARVNMGRIYEPDSGAQSLDHIRVFTLRSLKQLLLVHKFEILDVKGACAVLPENMRFEGIINVLDMIFTMAPSLAYRCIISCKEQES